MLACHSSGRQQLRRNGAPPSRVLTFLECKVDAAQTCKAALRRYEQAMRQSAVAAQIQVLQEVGRPERFAVLASSKRGSDVTRAEHQAAPQLQALSASLVAPPDRHSNRDYSAAVGSPTPGGDAAVARPTGSAATDSASDIYVIIHIDVGPPDRASGEAALTRLASDGRASSGNTRFDLWQQIERPNHFNIIAAWKNPAQYEQFVASPPGRTFRDVLAPMLASPYDARLFRSID